MKIKSSENKKIAISTYMSVHPSIRSFVLHNFFFLYHLGITLRPPGHAAPPEELECAREEGLFY